MCQRERHHNCLSLLFKACEKCQSLSCIQLFATPWTVAHQAPQFMGFSRQGYWSGLPCPSPGDLPDPGLWHSRQILNCLSHKGLKHKSTHLKQIAYTWAPTSQFCLQIILHLKLKDLFPSSGPPSTSCPSLILSRTPGHHEALPAPDCPIPFYQNNLPKTQLPACHVPLENLQCLLLPPYQEQKP